MWLFRASPGVAKGAQGAHPPPPPVDWGVKEKE